MKLARVLSLERLVFGRSPSSSKARSRKRLRARSAVWSGVVAFVVLTAALAGAVETVKPEWRDPEFALRLNQVREWKTKAPGRPLVVAFGSSRTQMGISPAAMGFPDNPDSPLVYNLGYRAAHPLGVFLQFTRLLDAGVKPAAVLVQLSAVELVILGPAERQYTVWAPRLTATDLTTWEPFCKAPSAFRWPWVRARASAWTTYREAVVNDLLPKWQTKRQREDFVWETMDEYGFAPHPTEVMPEPRRLEMLHDARRKHNRGFMVFTPGPTTQPAFRSLVERCRSEGIPVAFYWTPESATYQSWYSPRSRAAIAGFEQSLREEFGPVFPAPQGLLAESDFADGYHLLRGGAAKYSRWLADTHLKPWLASQGVGK